MLLRLTNRLPFLKEKDCVYCDIGTEYMKVLIENKVNLFYKKGEYSLFHCCVPYVRYTL
jgi:hypothetical protein